MVQFGIGVVSMIDEFRRPAPQRPAPPQPPLRPTAAAVDLYAFVRSLPANGRLSFEDSQILADWSERYGDAPLPSRDNVRDIIAKTLSAGGIADGDRTWLYFAVDPALPRQLRRVVQRQRLLAEVREARLNGVPCDSVSFDFLLAGGHLSGYRERIQSRLAVRTPVRFARDAEPVDVNDRIRIEIESGECVGFVPVDDAPSIENELSARGVATGVVKKILFDGLFPIPVIGTRVPYTVVEAEVPVAIEPYREPTRPITVQAVPVLKASPLSALTRALGDKLKPVTNLFK